MFDIAPLVRILPDVVLLEVFKRLPLLNLFKSVGLVCRGWRALYEHELLCRKNLILFPRLDKFKRSHCIPENAFHNHLLEHVRKDDGFRWIQPLPTEEQIRFNFMPMIHFTREGMTDRNIMPNITHLTLIKPKHVYIDKYERIIGLIRRWSTNLISLKLTLLYADYRCGEFSLRMILALFEQLNSISTLRHLKLKINSKTYCDSDFISLSDNLRLSFLSHLHTFCFESKGIQRIDDCLLSSLRQYASENVNLKICLHGKLDVGKILIFKNVQLTNKFVQLPKIFNWEDLSELFLTRFASLTALSLKIRQPYMMKKMSHSLQLLPNLISLSLDYGNLDSREPNNIKWNDPLGQQEHYSQVASVLLLVVTIQTRSNSDIAKLALQDIFTVVQVLQYCNDNITRKCSDCDYQFGIKDCPFEQDSALWRKIKECVHMSREAFRPFPKLHTIKYTCDENRAIDIMFKIIYKFGIIERKNQMI